MRVWKMIGALALATAMASPALAAEATVEGLWQPEDGLSDYQVSYCGADGTRFCLKVVALRGKADKEKNRPYVGTNIVDGAKASGVNRWKGKLNLFGQTADATFTLKSANVLVMDGCAYFVVCDTIVLSRAK